MNKIHIFSLFLLLPLLSCGGDEGAKADAQLPVSIDTLPLLVTRIQQCSRLYTTKYRVHKIVTHDDVISMEGKIFDQKYKVQLPLGQRKIAIPIDATLKAYIDMSKVEAANVSRNGNKITLTLPDPQVVMTSSKVDQEHIKEYVALLRAHFSDSELAAYEQQGREQILANVKDLGIVEAAKESAAKVLVPLIAQLGFDEQDITIEFRHDMRASQLRPLYDPSFTDQ